ncbi:hypothetical protein J4E82_007581 [Alternaria postmessia]|uniref:uncharacterized protein n=1 Tax=Alternaria postmessia TaxID=1187938 RepID=UPI0022248FD4|nr:uncharacterized protein J4E82_007581 [Alternaria postmessia]KAI5373768.1 hypothetical protein J4E82_007581 [Alternaria postmessia]
MGNNLLFKWEDSEALKHHCGFCERPLSHPGARASCFGKHSEPCVRFHQAMFMRLRGHTCKYCMEIDEQHYRRHHDIAERLRAVYESCGEVDWNIVPDEFGPEERGRVREPGDVDTPLSKRERKDAKRLVRAASRSRVITLEEIRYIDSVVHSAEGTTSNDADGPRDPEEVDEIERQLRYHAHVYSTQVSRRGLRKLAEAHEDTLDIDFEAEMERILETFRINKLLKRNTKTKGLQGKELKAFLNFVDGLKHAVLEDIVLVNKDNAESRMRRAGYLRYTNKTSYGIVEERYTDKDWKTGEKFASSSSDFSGAITPVHETSLLPSERFEDQSPCRPRTAHSPDRRHLESSHKRVSGDDGLYAADIEPYHTPLLSLPPAPASGMPVAAIMVINIKAPVRAPAPVRGRAKKPVKTASDGWKTVTNGGVPTKQIPKARVWGNIPSKRPAQASRPGPAPWSSDSRNFPDISAAKTSFDGAYSQPREVKPPMIWCSKEPETFVFQTEDDVSGHAAVSQKKKAKKAREAKRKAKKHSTSNEIITEDVGDEPDISMQGPSTPQKTKVDTNVLDIDETLQSFSMDTKTEGKFADLVVEPIAMIHDSSDGISPVPPPESMPITKHGKHMHWIRTGPFNRLRGEKLLSLYEKDHRTKGRLMLIDDDLINYFMEDPISRSRNRNPDGVPARLQKEYDDVKNGYNPGTLMAQELRFERLYAKNGFMKQELTQSMLQDIQRNEFERLDTRYMCYCRAALPKTGSSKTDIIVCSYRDCSTGNFHRSCIKKLGFGLVSRWYCTECEQKMKVLARQTLRRLGYTDIPHEGPCSYSYGLGADKFEEMFDEKFAEMMNSSDMEYLKLLPADLRSKVKEVGGFTAMPKELQQQFKEKVRALGEKFRAADVKMFDL